MRLLGPVFIAALLCGAPNGLAAPGDLDTSFGSGSGKVFTAIESGNDQALGAALQPDGKIVVVGYCSSSDDSDFCLVRYLPSGALHASFNGTGKAVTAIGVGSDKGRAIALQQDGKIVVVGECLNGNK